MKFKTTQKAIRANYAYVLAIGYCNAQDMLSCLNPIAYTTRREGWASDIYEITPSICIATGYAPFGNIRPDYRITREYNEMARNIRNNYDLPYNERKEKINALLIEYTKKVTSV